MRIIPPTMMRYTKGMEYKLYLMADVSEVKGLFASTYLMKSSFNLVKTGSKMAIPRKNSGNQIITVINKFLES